MARLGDICTIQSGGTPSRSIKDYWDNGTIPWVKISDFSGKYLDYTSEKITQAGLDNSSAKIFPKGTILYTIFATLGETCILNIDATTNQAIAGLKLNDDAVSLDYLYYYLLSKKDYVNEIGRGVAQNNINMKILRDMEIYIPSLEEQTRITQTLNKVYELITLRKEQLAKLDRLVKSRFVELLQPYFDKGETQPLIGLVCEDRPITYGILKPGTNREGGYPVIRVKDFSRGLVSVEEVLHTTPEIYNKYLRSVLAEGDIIISIGGTIGRIAIVPKEFVGANITQHTARIALKDKRYLLYFRGLLESDMMQRWMKDRVLGVAQPSINLGDVKQMPIPIVDECVIKELNAFVEQTDKSKLAIQQSLDKLETLKKSLMQEYFG